MSLSWDIRQGDALEELVTLKPNSVAAFVTDPPYCSGGFQEAAKRASKGLLGEGHLGRETPLEWFVGDNMGTSGLCWLLRNVAVQAHRSLVHGGSLLLFCDWRLVASLGPALESSGLRWQNTVVWAKSIGPGTGFRSSHELVLHLVKGVGQFYAKDVANVIDARRVSRKTQAHPTEKPVDLLQELVRVVAPEGGLVVDPFAGVGTCGVACKGIGRSWLGIERDPAYVEEAMRRLGQAPEPVGSLFGGA